MNDTDAHDLFNLPRKELVQYCWRLMEQQPWVALSPVQSSIFLSYTVRPRTSVYDIRRWAQCRKRGMKLVNVALVDGQAMNKRRPRYRVTDLVTQAKLRSVRITD